MTSHHGTDATARTGCRCAEFDVIGLPAPQGSKSAVARGGRAIVIEGSSKAQRERHGNWRSAVAEAARRAAAATPLDGPLHIDVTFRFPMPASRPKKIRAGGWAPKTSAPDLDKLLRATGDALTASGLIADDARICRIEASKWETTGWTGATIIVSEITPAALAPANWSEL